MKFKFVESLIPTLKKGSSCQFLLALLEGTNHEQHRPKVISLAT